MRRWPALLWWAALVVAQRPCSFNSLCWCRPREISCVAVPLHKLPEMSASGLLHVEIAGAGLLGLDGGALDALRLQSLALPDNRLHILPDKTFSSMATTLSSLDLGYNEFSEIPLSTLKALKILNWLNMQNNNLVSTVGDWGSMKDSLTSIILSGNNIVELSSGAGYSLSQLKHLVKIDLDNNKIHTIGKKSLPQSLQSLNLAGNLLESFPFELISSLHHLQSLNLRGNLIQRIPHITFKHHKNLEKLEMGDNGLEAWYSNMFNDTLAVRHLSLELNYLRVIPAYAFKGMNIAKLVLSYNKIEMIDDDAFQGLEHTLEQLDLEHNQLLAVPRAIMSLKRLKHLYLPSNKIATIDYLPQHVKVLSLNGNSLTAVPREALRNCSLTHLDIGYNLIAYIEEGDFDVWGESVRTLYLRSNKITRLDSGVFSSLPQLRELSLSFNDIHYVHPDVFQNMSHNLKILEMSFSMYRDDFPEDVLKHLTSLEWVSLDNNNIQALAQTSLSNMQKLQYISLEFNRITSIPPFFFDTIALADVKEIKFSYNLLEVLESDTFASLHELQILDLSVNRIRNISAGAFKNVQKLLHVTLQDNLLTDVGEGAFCDLPNLLKLEMQSNQLKEFSLRAFQNVSDIDMPLLLNISRNQIVWLDGSGGDVFVETLDTSHNRLADTPTGFLSRIAKRLKRLVLSFNEIGHLDTNSFVNMEMLEILNLDHNYISSVRRRAFLGLNYLQILDLSHNRIEQLSVEQFSNLNSLRFLNLRRNHIRSLPRDVFKNTMLEHLDLSINEFIVLPAIAFSQIGFTLRYLDMSHNSIESVDSTMFQDIQFLLSLDLSGNKLTILSDNLFSSICNLQVLDLSSNPVRANFKELLHYLPITRSLSLSNIGLKTFPYIPLRNLTSLNLTFNHIENVKEAAVKDLGNLRYLHLKGNMMTSVPSHVWPYMRNLKMLDLSKNPIQYLSKQSFYGLESLVHLDINNLHKLGNFEQETLSTVRSLAFLRTETKSHIKDYRLGDVVTEVPGLRKLHVHVNDDMLIDQLSGVFVPKLKHLEISGAGLRKITAEAFEGAETLYELEVQVRDTGVRELPPGLLGNLGQVPQLSLDFSHNQLAALSPATLYPNTTSWERLATKLVAGGLTLSDNPLSCDCAVAWLGRWVRRWAREAGGTGVTCPPVTCMWHGSGRTSNLLGLYPEDLRCHASALAAAAPAPAPTATALILMAAPYLLTALMMN
ncbi:uncharacterized protein LOC143917287 [Arctopsyche grandis]|uniref:uncharacterized protein LOC143917287 n=1 Tax=Arctopsyche grandis TaxID=121162 RepID=UPI00406D918D